jgi:hypothetical protein
MSRLFLAILLLVATAAAAAAEEPSQLLSITDLDPTITGSPKDDVTDALAKALRSDRAIGRKIFFPSGTYRIRGPVLQMTRDTRVSLVGEGIGNTIFSLHADSEEPIFSLRGEELYAPPYRHLSWITIDNIEFSGNKRRATWFDMKFVGHVYFSRCLWRNTRGPALAGTSWWDTNFDECHWVNCGVPEVPCVLAYHSSEPERKTWCNNLVFTNCRWEGCPGDGIHFTGDTARNRLLSCKFDRVAGRCIVFSDARPNIVTATQFVGCTTAIYAERSKGILVTSCLFDNFDIGVELRQCNHCIVDNNVFNLAIVRPRNRRVVVEPRGIGNKIEELGIE